MATTLQSFGLSSTPQNVSETALGNTVIKDILQGNLGAIETIDIDNTANGAATYFKAFNSAAPVLGTDAPDLIIMLPASVRRVVVFPDGWDFSNLSFAAVTTGGTTGTTSPTSSVPVELAVGSQR